MTAPIVTSRTIRLGMLMAFVGGYLDVYTFLDRGGVFANAQTGNLIFLSTKAVRGDFAGAAAHIPPAVAFVAGVMTARYLATTAARSWLTYPVRTILIVEATLLVVVGFVPGGSAGVDLLATVFVAYTAAIQVSVFQTLVDISFSTTMTTGNMKSLAANVYDWLVEHRREARAPAARLTVIIVAFLVGGVISAVASPTFGVRTVWFVVPVFAVALAVFVYDDRHRSSARTTGS